MLTLTSPITGSSITGFTTPAYLHTVDGAPNNYSKQVAVTSITGTQAGVDASGSASRPWTLTTYRPQNIKTLNSVDGNNVLRVVPYNTYGLRVRKGLTPLAGQASRTGFMLCEFSVPAGSDLADQPNIKALVSSGVGALNQLSSGIADTIITGVI